MERRGRVPAEGGASMVTILSIVEKGLEAEIVKETRHGIALQDAAVERDWFGEDSLKGLADRGVAIDLFDGRQKAWTKSISLQAVK